MRVPAQPGAFVRVSGARDGIAKLVEVRGGEASVEYFDSLSSRIARTVPTWALRPATLHGQTRCYWIEDDRWRIGRVRERADDGYLVVSQQVHRVVSEAELFVRWAHPLADPTEVLAARGNESPLFHRSRMAFVESLLAQRSASRGLTGVLSARTELHRHQVETARRVLEDPIPRYILADEVGLGKTIEAGFVIRQFLLDTPDARVLVLVPPFLVRQWQEELESKFYVGDFAEEACRVVADTGGDWGQDDDVDLLVVDEAHHLAAGACSDVPARRELYVRAARVAAATPRLLLLSATPLLHNEATFLAMLHLIDAASYPLDGLEPFRARVAARSVLGRVLLGFTDDAPPFLLDQPLRELRALFPQDARLARLLAAVEDSLAAPDDDRANRVSAVRVHLSETHRIYRRLLRTRRSDELADSFPVRGRDGANVELAEAEVELADADDRGSAEAWLEKWRETVVLEAATEASGEARGAREAALAAVFAVFLPRACSSVRSLVAAVRCRADSSALADDADLTLAELAAIRSPSVSSTETAVLRELLLRFEEFRSDARQEALAALIDARADCKLVVFASFLHVAGDVHAALAARFGSESVARHTADMAPADVDAEVARFRAGDRCRVLVCDASGEEGRNLQFADLLVHFDLPWSPNRLEQRLGRLDRYGVGSTVECVVFADTPDVTSYHDAWRRCLAENFKVFSRSVAAFQFAIDAVMARLRDALFLGGLNAFGDLALEIGTALEAEARSIAEQDVLDSIEAVDRDVRFFDELEKCDARDATLRRGFECWAGAGAEDQASLQLACQTDAHNPRVVSYSPVLRPPRQTMIPANWLLRWFPSGQPIRGTFARNTALRTSSARLLRVGTPFYDEVRAFSEWDDRGRVFAFWRYRPAFANRDPDWAFRFDYIVEGDPEPALRIANLDTTGDDAAVRASFQRRLDGLLPPFLCTLWLDAAGNLVTDATRRVELEAPYDKAAGDVNLRPGRFEQVDRRLGLREWPEITRHARLQSETLLRASGDFIQRLAACTASSSRLLDGRVEVLRGRAERPDSSASELREADCEALLAEALLAGIRSPRVRLEAVGFVCLAGTPMVDGDPANA